jgi:hypothetical protein
MRSAFTNSVTVRASRRRNGARGALARTIRSGDEHNRGRHSAASLVVPCCPLEYLARTAAHGSGLPVSRNGAPGGLPRTSRPNSPTRGPGLGPNSGLTLRLVECKLVASFERQMRHPGTAQVGEHARPKRAVFGVVVLLTKDEG